MKEIPLTQGKVALVDDEPYEWLNSFKWYAHRAGNTFYAVRSIKVNGKQRTQQMHVLIMGGDLLKPHIDHRDGNGCNNQISNLRICTHQENMMNRRPQKNSSSIYKGVGWYKAYRKWMAYVCFNGKMLNLGYFEIEEEAARAHDVAALKYHAEFAYLNFK